eukprot:3661080-Rhodomonas_salina.1
MVRARESVFQRRGADGGEWRNNKQSVTLSPASQCPSCPVHVAPSSGWFWLDAGAICLLTTAPSRLETDPSALDARPPCHALSLCSLSPDLDLLTRPLLMHRKHTTPRLSRWLAFAVS